MASLLLALSLALYLSGKKLHSHHKQKHARAHGVIEELYPATGHGGDADRDLDHEVCPEYESDGGVEEKGGKIAGRMGRGWGERVRG
tara:strand:- start:2649 stop:2909 length:261 start_codon:yes stop_codon:yes gene_type:complete